MATIARPTKVGGGTSVVDGTIGYAADWNGDIDTIYTDYNGNITNANLSASAVIAETKIDDISASSTTHQTTEDPGFLGSENLPTDLQTELRQLRHMILALGNGIVPAAAQNLDAPEWFDRPPKSENLLLNPGLFSTQVATAAPDFWTLVGTPTISTSTTDATFLGRHPVTSIAATGAQEGIQQTLTGLRPSTMYAVGCLVRATANPVNFHLITTGAEAGSYGDIDAQSDSDSAYVALQAVIKTDSTPTDIVVKLVCDDTGSANIVGTFVRECSTAPVQYYPGHNFTVTSTLNETRITTLAWNSIRSAGSLDMKFDAVQRPNGMLLKVSASVYVKKNTSGGEVKIRIFDVTNAVVIAEVGMDMLTDGQASLVIPPVLYASPITAVVDIALQGRCENDDADVNPSSPLTGDTSQSWFTVELVRA